jgi:hypothetical protein
VDKPSHDKERVIQDYLAAKEYATRRLFVDKSRAAEDYAEFMKRLDRNDSCHRCNQDIDLNDITGELEYELNVITFGGYMSFVDDMEPIEKLPPALLCHDCAVELYRWLGYNPVKHKDMRGLHPDRYNGSKGERMCCEFAWRITSEPDDDETHIEHGHQVNLNHD